MSRLPPSLRVKTIERMRGCMPAFFAGQHRANRNSALFEARQRKPGDPMRKLYAEHARGEHRRMMQEIRRLAP